MQAAIDHLRNSDPILAAIIERIGPYALVLRKPTFETLSRSIIYQQVSGKSAAAVCAKLKQAVGARFTAVAVARLTAEELRACGLSRQKAAYLQNLAEHVIDGRLSFRKLAVLDDQQVIEQLSQVKGIGVWTAQMFLMFALERPNVMPLADLGVRNAVRLAYGLEQLPTAAELVALSEGWHPYCTVACWYLWRSFDGTASL